MFPQSYWVLRLSIPRACRRAALVEVLDKDCLAGFDKLSHRALTSLLTKCPAGRAPRGCGGQPTDYPAGVRRPVQFVRPIAALRQAQGTAKAPFSAFLLY
ncbi:MAG TPA: hypothetical protein DCP32_06615 [Anaerolineaceae bacterium]|nr:MAG: hypothetical protein A2X24_12825 [Chloroflexi bacterium GWB2_54_36]HAL16422.1 hypothetical protein [Anaerolineaceae bacterium]